MPDALRTELGPEWLAYYALTQDEPIEFAEQYLKTAHERVGKVLAQCRGKNVLPPQAAKELADLQLFLMGLAMAADPTKKTPVNLRFVRAKGRPKKNIVLINRYRAAALNVLRHKEEHGYDSAVTAAVATSGLNRTEVEAWASHLEREYARNGVAIK